MNFNFGDNFMCSIVDNTQHILEMFQHLLHGYMIFNYELPLPYPRIEYHGKKMHISINEGFLSFEIIRLMIKVKNQ